MTKKETAVLIGVTIQFENSETTEEHLNELEFLAMTAGAKTLKRFTQKMEYPHPKTYLGSGKLKEVKDFIKENEADMAIIDDELSPLQLKNLEKILECKVLDRTNLILDIFAGRAKTAQAKKQVELAQCEYLLPRLTKMWTHLSRQKGGIGMKGPGETEIETDRRIIRNKISLLKKKLQLIDKQNQTQRKNRGQKVRVALVGYTNAGKSTLMNLLSKADIFAEDKLFATLDTTVRKVVHEQIPYLLSDTVGFIRKLPHSLVESFKSTLDEVREADLLIHLVDISHSDYEHHIDVVNKTLEEIGASGKAVLLVFNKIDKLDAGFFSGQNGQFSGEVMEAENTLSLKEIATLLDKSYMHKNTKAIFISAIKKFNIYELQSEVLELVKDTYRKVYPYYPLNVSLNG